MNINFRNLGFPRLNLSFSSLQTIVGLIAGIVSITGALGAYLKTAPGKGELVAIVQDAKNEKVLPDATIEILTPRDALITTLKPNGSGKVRYSLDEGRYRLRVSHPQYTPEAREVQLISSHSTEVHVRLRGVSVGGAMRRLFHH